MIRTPYLEKNGNLSYLIKPNTMSTTTNEIVLRPRFKFGVKQDNELLLKLFEDTKSEQSDFVVSRVDDHVFIKIPKAKQHFWSPQLHLEINKAEDEQQSVIHGLFGPNPTVWTMFMFFHFLVAALFIGFGIWAYVNWSLEANYAIQLFVTLLMVVFWFALYFGGRLGKKAGHDEMHQLHHFMRDTLRDKHIHAEIISFLIVSKTLQLTLITSPIFIDLDI